MYCPCTHHLQPFSEWMIFEGKLKHTPQGFLDRKKGFNHSEDSNGTLNSSVTTSYNHQLWHVPQWHFFLVAEAIWEGAELKDFHDPFQPSHSKTGSFLFSIPALNNAGYHGCLGAGRWVSRWSHLWEAVPLHFEQQRSQQKTAAIVYIAEHAVGFHRPVKSPIVSKPHFS